MDQNREVARRVFPLSSRALFGEAMAKRVLERDLADAKQVMDEIHDNTEDLLSRAKRPRNFQVRALSVPLLCSSLVLVLEHFPCAHFFLHVLIDIVFGLTFLH